ncbi:MAG: ArsR/SmtB family transcription factor [Dehalococcoidia bacterium]
MQTQVRQPGRCEEQGLHPAAIQAARIALISDEDLTGLAETFSALADSNRMKILFALATTDLCVCDLASVVGVSESAISQHLRVLKSLRWVKGRRDGRMVYYFLADHHVRSLLELELEHVRGG